MTLVQVRELELVSPNPAGFETPFVFRMRLESIEPLQSTIEVSFIWVGSANSDRFDQVLDEIEVGPLVQGLSEFEIEISPPDVSRIPQEELLGPTVMYIVLAYKGAPFLRIGYYINVAYFLDHLNQHPPLKVDLASLGRSVLMTKPAITTYDIMWDDMNTEEDDDA